MVKEDKSPFSLYNTVNADSVFCVITVYKPSKTGFSRLEEFFNNPFWVFTLHHDSQGEIVCHKIIVCDVRFRGFGYFMYFCRLPQQPRCSSIPSSPRGITQSSPAVLRFTPKPIEPHRAV